MGTRKKKKNQTETEHEQPATGEQIDQPAAEDMQKEMDELKRQLAEKTDLAQGYFAQLQRVQADFENFQKRIDAEKSRIADSTCAAIVSGLLETLDNFEKAISFLKNMPPEESSGVLMVYENMLAYLEKNGLERIASEGCSFDPHRHDAIMQIEVETGADGTVLEEFQTGYTMKGRVIRPAKVKVARLKKNEDNNILKEE